MPGTLDWIWAILGALLLLAGVPILIRALRDPLRGRPRCPHCWYELSGTPHTHVCPECGRQTPSYDRLPRVRRRWGLAAVSVVMILAARPVWIMPWFKRLGWMAIIPTDLLVRIAPVDESAWLPPNREHSFTPVWKFSGPKDPLLAHLIRRTQTAYVMKPRHWRAFLDRYFNANPDDLFNIVRTRSTWVADVPIEASLDQRHPIISVGVPSGDQAIQIYARLAGPYTTWSQPQAQWLMPVTLDAPSGDEPEAYLEIEIQRLGHVIWHGYSSPITITARAEDVMTGYDRDGLGEHIAQGLTVELIRSDNQLYLFLPGDKNHLDGDRFAPDWAFGFVAEVRCNDRLIATGRDCRDMLKNSVIEYSHVINAQLLTLSTTPEYAAGNFPPNATWTLRLRGDASASLIDIHRTHYWSGSVDIPITAPHLPSMFEQGYIDDRSLVLPRLNSY